MSVKSPAVDPRPTAPRAAEPAAPAPVAVPPPAPEPAQRRDLFDGIGKIASGAVGKIGHWFEKHVERPFAMGRDGYVALDGGKVVGGLPPSVEVRDLNAPKTPLDPLLKIISPGDARDVTFTLPGGGSFQSRTDGTGFKELPIDALSRSPIGVVDLQVSTPGGQGDESRVLALPKDYDGPIFITDIDSTLRDTRVLDLADGKTAPPIPGARELLQEVARRGIPIVYLSAGVERLRPANEAFLDQLPKGILLDRTKTRVLDAIPLNGVQARQQGLYKAAAMEDLHNTFPNAKLFGLGDDNYGDAQAYTKVGATAYIHDVRAGDDNIPADFHGTLTQDYNPGFIAKVAGDLQRAIETSAFFGGSPQAVDESKEISAQLDQLTGTKVTQGNKVQLLVDGPQAFPEVLNTIDSAKSTLNYEIYQFLPGERTTEQIVDHLIAAKQRGVAVRVLADAFGSKEALGKNPSLERLRQAGIEVRDYNPMDSVGDVVDFHRDHRKVIVADGSTAMVGGMNTGDRYYGPVNESHLHDLFTEIQGPAAGEVAKAFYDSWQAAGGTIPDAEKNAPPPPPVADGQPLRIIAHVPGQDQDIRAAYLTLFDHAQKRINVENSYPMTDDLVDSLVAAARRGVEVRYVVGSGQGIQGSVTKKNFQRLLDAGAHVYVYPGGIHTKAISVDGRFATVGSSNVDNTALSRNREIIAVMDDPAQVQAFDQAVFDRDVAGDPMGRKTIELPKKLDEPFWQKVKDWAIAFAFPDTYE